MKILEVNRWLAPGGGERFIVDLSNELAKNNEVYVCTYIDDTIGNNSFYKSQLNHNVNYVNLGGKLGVFNQLINMYKVFKYILKLKPDVVHCHLSGFYMCVLPSLFFRKIKFVNTLHNVAHKNIKPGIEKILKGGIYRFFIKAVTISPTCYNSFTNYMKFNNTIMIDNGCRNIHKTEKYEYVKNEIESYKITSKTKVFVNVARLHPQKNHQLLVRAFNILIGKGYDVVLLIIGSLDGYPKIFNELNELIESDRIHLMGTRNNVQDYLYCCDAFCLSSRWEGAPISLLEAGFAGCYPICTPAGGCVDDILDERWGLLSKDFSVEEYVNTIEKFMKMDVPSKENISFLYKSRFSMEKCKDKYVSLFHVI